MLAAEPGRDRPLLEGVVQRRLRLEEIAHGEEEPGHELPQEYAASRAIQPHGTLLSACARAAMRAYGIDAFSAANRKSTPDRVRDRLSPENALVSPRSACRASTRAPRRRARRPPARCAATATASARTSRAPRRSATDRAPAGCVR